MLALSRNLILLFSCCAFCAPGWVCQRADTSNRQGEAGRLQERQQAERPGSGAWPGTVTSAVTSTGFMGERGPGVSRQVE